jgi:hypothetical protein
MAAEISGRAKQAVIKAVSIESPVETGEASARKAAKPAVTADNPILDQPCTDMVRDWTMVMSADMSLPRNPVTVAIAAKGSPRFGVLGLGAMVNGTATAKSADRELTATSRANFTDRSDTKKPLKSG